MIAVVAVPASLRVWLWIVFSLLSPLRNGFRTLGFTAWIKKNVRNGFGKKDYLGFPHDT